MWLVVGVALVVIGLVGVSNAQAIVSLQHRQNVVPVEFGELDDTDRVQITKGVGVLSTLVGFGLILLGVL